MHDVVERFDNEVTEETTRTGSVAAVGDPDAGPVEPGVSEAGVARRNRRPRSRRRRPARLRDRLRRLSRIVPRRSGTRLRLAALVCVIGGFIVISARNDVPVRLVERAAPGAVRSDAGPVPVSGRPTDPSMAAATGEEARVTAPARRAASSDAPDTRLLSPAVDPDVPSLEALRECFVAFDEPIVHEVSDGGSLWRTVSPIVGGDDALLDAFVDALSASGMRVGSVRAGTPVMSDGAVERGHRLRVDDREAVYVGRLVDGAVTTSVYRIVTVTVRTSFERDALAAGVPDTAIEALFASDVSMAAMLENVAAGGTIDILLSSVTDAGGAPSDARVLAVATGAGVHRLEGVDPDDLSSVDPRVGLGETMVEANRAQ